MMFIAPLVSHLWQSTLFAAGIALLSLALKKNQARWRSHLWLAASIKFLIPFSALATIGSKLVWRTAASASTGLSVFVEEVTQSFEPVRVPHVVLKTTASDASHWATLLVLLWCAGFAAALFRWWLDWRRVRTAVRAAVPLGDGRELQALRRVEQLAGIRRPTTLLGSDGRLEPGVFGVLRTCLLWPAGISAHLGNLQLEAIMAHEICHLRRRDNLAAALHQFVACLFWFHPLVWWLGARLVDEREKACDEEVLRLGSEPAAYAESILKTCQFYLEAPQLCMSGVTGSDLKKRIERIMARRVGSRLDLGRKLLLAGAGVAAVAGPIAFGIATAPSVRAQSQPASSPAFEVASVKPNNSDDHRVMFQITPGGRVNCTNVSPKMLITMAYDLKPNQLTGGPGWMDNTRYDISAKANGPDDPERTKLMMRTLLADRFKLVVHRETKEMAIYELVAAKSGPKLKPSAEGAGDRHKGQFRMGRGQLDLEGATMAEIADSLSRVVGRNVFDHTGLSGTFDVKLEWTPDEGELPEFKDRGPGAEGRAAPPESTGPSLSTALQEQAGLKLEASKGPVEIVVIDHIEKASEN